MTESAPSAAREFVERKRPATCPVCGHADRCKSHRQHGDDLIVCFRIADKTVNGFHRLKHTGECSTYVRAGSPADRNGKAENKPARPRPTLTERMRQYQGDATGEHVAELADRLGVSIVSLREIGVGFQPLPCFPEVDAAGNVIAINVRYSDGSKKVGKGERRGLIVPSNLAELPDPVLIVEGVSDTSAALTMGLTAVGRFNYGGGADELAKLLPGRDCIVCGHNDKPQANGSIPGHDGAKKVAAALSASWDKPVPWAMPTSGFKDLRDYLKSFDDPADAGAKLREHLHATATVEAPQPASPKSDDSAELRSNRLTELWLGQRLARLHGNDLRWTAAHDWLTWDGTRWRRDITCEVERRAKETIQALYAEAAQIADDVKRQALVDFARGSERNARIKAVVELARSEKGIAIRAEQLDADPWLLNVANGTIDLRTGTLQKHRRDDLITKLAPVVYDSCAKCPTFDKFLADIMPNESMRCFIQRAIGHALTGVIREHVLHILHGVGANGKTTLCLTLLKMLGDYGKNAAPHLLMARRHEQHPTELAELCGVRAAICMESSEGGRLDEERVKMLTGGDRLTARYMRQDFFQFDATHKVFLSTNHRPRVRGTDLAIWRRMRLWPFNVTIAEADQDKTLIEKLERELPGILAMAVRSCLDWQRGGLAAPVEVTGATATYRQESDALGVFIAECCVLPDGTGLYESDLKVGASDLYARFKQWCADGGEHCITQTDFGRRLRERGFDRKPFGKTRRDHYFGIGLREPVKHREGETV